MEATPKGLARKAKKVVRASNEVVLMTHGRPMTRIVPIRKPDRKRLAEALRELGPIDLPARK